MSEDQRLRSCIPVLTLLSNSIVNQSKQTFRAKEPIQGIYQATPILHADEYFEEDEENWPNEYLLPTFPKGPFSIYYFLYWYWTRLVKLWDWIFARELVDFGKGLYVHFQYQIWSYLMSWQVFNFTVSVIEDSFIKVWSRAIENTVSSQIRLVRRYLDLYSNFTYLLFGVDFWGRWYKDSFSERWNRSSNFYTILWNKDDTNMAFLEYWLNKLTIQPLTHNGAIWNRFEMFRISYNKSYEPAELLRRATNFAANLEVIYNLNKNEMGTAVYGVTPYADMSVKEFAEMFGAYDPAQDSLYSHFNEEIRPVAEYVPENFDWRLIHPAVTRLKNYVNCPAVWAYTVVENVETLYAIKTGYQFQFSDQQVIDCCNTSNGCRGGSVANAYNYIHETGLTVAWEYSFRGYQGECNLVPSKRRAFVKIQKGFNFIVPDEEKIRNYLYSFGPVTTRINIAPLQFYKKGIIRCSPKLCNPQVQNYVVNFYGYGVQTKRGGIPVNSIPYWIAKNYWGRMWGEEGFFRIYRGENTLGLGNFATAPVLL